MCGLYFSVCSLDNGQSPFIRFKKIRSPNLPDVGPDYFVDHEDLKTAFAFSKGIHSGNLPAYLENKPPVKMHTARLRYSFYLKEHIKMYIMERGI